jgi:spore coat polysaccharide biosynthesis predicted glycosyltransferase SpsG
MGTENNTLLIITEASELIGTGHLLESFHLAKMAAAFGIKVSLWANQQAPESLLAYSPLPLQKYGNLEEEISNMLKEPDVNGFSAIVTNCRFIDNRTLAKIRGKTCAKILCIDELGNRPLDCDVIINPLPAGKYDIYPEISKQTVYSGPGYLIMSESLQQAHKIERDYHNGIKTISVCMGGVDRSGATLKIIDILADWKASCRKNLILGGGFPWFKEVRTKIRSMPGLGFKVYQNISNITDLFLDSDVVFSAGGNTLFELACVGTPAIVLYEDEHEAYNSLSFSKQGFGLCPGSGTTVNRDDILKCLDYFDDPDVRMQHAERGKQLVDGRGCERIIAIVKGLISSDFPV